MTQLSKSSKTNWTLYDSEEAEYAEKELRLCGKEDAGRGYRRVVASPATQKKLLN